MPIDDKPLPGTQCVSVALIDTQSPPRHVSLEKSAALGANRLFALSTLAASTVTLNAMSPVANQLGQLKQMLEHGARPHIN